MFLTEYVLSCVTKGGANYFKLSVLLL